MVVYIQENLGKDKKLEKENLFIMMGVIILANFLIIIFMVKANIFGLMEENMKEIGNSIKQMGKEFLNGMMEGNIVGNIKMIKIMDMVFLNALMEKNIKDFGRMENKMEKGIYMI